MTMIESPKYRSHSDFPLANNLYGVAVCAGISEDVAMQVVDYTVGVIHLLERTDWVCPWGELHQAVGKEDSDDDGD
jgi:hypothetical protein